MTVVSLKVKTVLREPDNKIRHGQQPILLNGLTRLLNGNEDARDPFSREHFDDRGDEYVLLGAQRESRSQLIQAIEEDCYRHAWMLVFHSLDTDEHPVEE